MNKAQRDIRWKKRVLEHAARIGNVRKACRYYGVARSGFYRWKKVYETDGLVNKKPCPENPRLRTPLAIVETVLHLRRTYNLGPICIMWYLELSLSLKNGQADPGDTAHHAPRPARRRLV